MVASPIGPLLPVGMSREVQPGRTPGQPFRRGGRPGRREDSSREFSGRFLSAPPVRVGRPYRLNNPGRGEEVVEA